MDKQEFEDLTNTHELFRVQITVVAEMAADIETMLEDLQGDVSMGVHAGVEWLVLEEAVEVERLRQDSKKLAEAWEVVEKSLVEDV
jgi:intracellular sulfur oxidation DsrE/DsrF family protein